MSGDVGLTVSGDVGLTVSGDMGLTVSGDMGLTVSGDMGLTVNGDMGLTVNGDMGLTVNGGFSAHPELRRRVSLSDCFELIGLCRCLGLQLSGTDSSEPPEMNTRSRSHGPTWLTMSENKYRRSLGEIERPSCHVIPSPSASSGQAPRGV